MANDKAKGTAMFLPNEVRERLEALKVVPEEPLYRVVERLMDGITTRRKAVQSISPR